MTTATSSSSDRYDHAREALAHYTDLLDRIGDGKDVREQDETEAARDCAEALRALITPPATEWTAEQTALYLADKHGVLSSPVAVALATEAVHAGIQAAWESWEPENAPGRIVATMEQYGNVCNVIDRAKNDDRSEDTDYYASAVLDVLGVAL